MNRRKLTRDARGLRAALDALGVEVRFNIRSQRCELRESGGHWQAANDRTEAALQERIAVAFTTGQKRVPLCFGFETWRRSLNALLADAEVDPFREWLEALPRWDRVARLSHWLPDVFEIEPGRLPEWASLLVFLGAIWRTYQPGCKLDEMPVFVGPQGIGKSTGLSSALPPEHPEWFADGLHLAASPKERAEALQGRVIVEASEMVGSNRAELESLKAFLSRTDDGSIRLSYRRNPETMLRRCVIVGTANDGGCLPNDPGGNRRFVAIDVKAGEGGAAGVRGYMAHNRIQLWAEAVLLYRQGVEARLPDDLKANQAEANERHRGRDDILEDAVERWLPTAPEQFSLADAAVGCGLIDSNRATSLPMRDQRRLGAALSAAECVKRRVWSGGGREMVWERPPCPPSSTVFPIRGVSEFTQGSI